MDQLKFTCPRCAGDNIRRMARSTLMRCQNKKCDFTAPPSDFKLEKRPSLKWGEARETRGDTYE
jgi:hypothetical protein